MNNSETVKRIRDKTRERLVYDLVYEIQGVRGRSIRVYPYKCIINTSVTAGSLLTNNATDGEKTIYYKDVVGIQYKRSGVTIGYLQFETSSGTMNHDKSNYFSENTFTFESDKDEIMEEVYEYIIGIFDELKSASTEITVNTSDGIRTEKLNALLEFYYRELVKNNPEYHNMQKMLKEDVSDLEKEVTDALMQYNEVRAEAKLLNENILKNQEQLDKLQGEIIRLKTYGKASSVSEKIKLKEAESEKLELLLVELKKEKNEIDERLEQKKEDHSKKYQLLKEKQSELRKTQ